MGLDSQFLFWVSHPKRLGHSLLMHCLSPNSDPILTLLVSNTKREKELYEVGDLWWLGPSSDHSATFLNRWASTDKCSQNIIVPSLSFGCRNFDQTSWSRLFQRRSRMKQRRAMPADLEASEESALSKPGNKSWWPISRLTRLCTLCLVC